MAFRKEKGYVTRLFHHHTPPQHIKRAIALSQYNTAQRSNRTVSGRQWPATFLDISARNFNKGIA